MTRAHELFTSLDEVLRDLEADEWPAQDLRGALRARLDRFREECRNSGVRHAIAGLHSGEELARRNWLIEQLARQVAEATPGSTTNALAKRILADARRFGDSEFCGIASRPEGRRDQLHWELDRWGRVGFWHWPLSVRTLNTLLGEFAITPVATANRTPAASSR